ncbi:unnamed protein product [Cyberlindnera jadinii]|uniref:Kinesin motor domain-containing protein n=1 Tax=Cyberlindnera jadinii (strain ATCC 18201 / CBS 1600 / BCRC 20928 / JCM 3617 / NBRC 0987 / NRRL Y-1542) TaxID=983966 RepID=A0A0H5C5M2_CYBJN|nr:unnamed protein product [Cyberlindnera jadinii]
MTSVPHFLRLKPRGDTPGDREKECLIEYQNNNEVKFKDTTSATKFTKVFSEISQLDLYDQILKESTEELFLGKDSVFFTLGPSNSGKSYSVYGDASNPGLSIYSLNEIFNKIGGNFADYKQFKRYFGEHFMITSNSQRDSQGEYGLSISVFEIYNDRIRDLSLDSKKTENQSLDIVTDSKDGKIKPNRIRQIYVTNLEDAKTVLHKCIKRRAVSSTNLNETSSRSHLFIYFNLHKVIGKCLKTTRLTIADLAGSERSKTAKTEGKEFKEGNYTNTSLTELGRCLVLMKSKRFDRSNLRTSKLTRLLLTDLFGNLNHNRVKILLTLDPYSSLSTIIHAVRYIQPISKVQINSARNSLESTTNDDSEYVKEIHQLKELNKSLSDELEMVKNKTVEIEMDIRSEVVELYEQKIRDLEIINDKAMNDLKETHERDVDEKLKLLSEEYDLQKQKLIESYESQLNDLQSQMLQAESKSLELSELKVKELEKQIEDYKERERQMLEKNVQNSKRIDELTVQLSKGDKKRPSEEGLEQNQSTKKVRFSGDGEINEHDLVLSPIKLIKSSPNKHFKFEDNYKSPGKSIKNNHFKFDTDGLKSSPVKSPLKSPLKPLRESTNSNTRSSPLKSPSKGKKKINNTHHVVDTDDYDLFN